jgi:tRNA acetyltransferase TAN1
MLRDFNLIITTTRGKEIPACSEAWYLLNQIGDPAPKIDKTGISGVVTAQTTFQPQEAISMLRALLKERPQDFHFILRVIPVQKVIHTDLHEIEQAATQLAAQIQRDEAFRVTVEKRFTNKSTEDIIRAAARNIENKVSLTSPDKTLLIEVVGRLTGLSIIRTADIMSTAKERT